jgi:transcriptional regulator with XRE-family HTH domain
MTYESLARRLRVLRAARGITLAEAEELTGVTRETLGALEHGQRGAYTSTLEKIAKGYGTTVSALLEEDPEANMALAGSSKAEAPPETGPASLTREQAAASLQRLQSPPEIELEQLHDHGIPASHADVRTLNMYLEGFWRAQRTGQPFAVASLAKNNVDYEHIALLATYVLTTTKEPRFLTPEQVEAVHQGIHDQLVGARG